MTHQIVARRAIALPASDADPLARRALIAMALIAIVSVGIGTGVLVAGGQQFARFGLVKRLLLPGSYLVAAVALLGRGRSVVRTVVPAWWLAMAASLLASTAAAALAWRRQSLSLSDLAQGVLLPAGFLLFAVVGLHASRASKPEMHRLMALLGCIGLIVSNAHADGGILSSVAVPSGFAFVYWGLRPGRYRAAKLLAGGYLVFWSVRQSVTDPLVSVAYQAEVAAGLGLLILALLPARFRAPLVLLGVLAAPVVLARTTVVRLMLGHVPPGVTDVTLTHRAYEAAQVYRLVGSDPVSLLLGAGPDATVDLSLSPDWATLAAAGRDLTAVDDVHFFLVWVWFKFGMLGLAALAWMLFSLARATLRALRPARPAPEVLYMAMLAWAGIGSAFPAATKFYSNPLLAFAVGWLMGTTFIHRPRRSES